LQVNKSGIIVKALKPRILVEVNHPVGALTKGFIQPFKRLILVAEASVDSRNVIGGNISIL
jgi:hypothetical protein